MDIHKHELAWGCSIRCPTSPCCLEMATVLMKGLHLRCAPRWELSIRVLDLFVKTFGMEFRQLDATIDQILQQLSKRLPSQHHSKRHFSQCRLFPRRNHSPKIIGSCANSGETKRADAVSQRHGGPFSMRHWHSKIKEVCSEFLVNIWRKLPWGHHLICLHQAPPLDFSCLHFFLPWRDLLCSPIWLDGQGMEVWSARSVVWTNRGSMNKWSETCDIFLSLDYMTYHLWLQRSFLPTTDRFLSKLPFLPFFPFIAFRCSIRAI